MFIISKITTSYDCNILYKETKKHPLYSEMEEIGLIHLVSDKCLINCENQNIIDNAAITLAKLNKAQHIKPKTRKLLI